MQLHKALVSIATIAVAGSHAAAQVSLVSQARNVHVVACTPQQSQGQSAPDFNPFNAGVAITSCPSGPFGAATSSQNSLLSTTQFMCSQTTQSAGNGGADGLFQVVFDVTSASQYSLTGSTNSAQATITLVGPGVNSTISNQSRTDTGVLGMGRYTLTSTLSGILGLGQSSVTMTITAPQFAVDWYSIDDGGVMNAVGGPYNVSGTIAQPDSTGRATLVGGTFSLTGGFWAIVLPRCDADFNNDGTVNSQDFFDFVTAFFQQSPAADYNRDAFINSQDFFDFITAFFTPCS